MNKLPYKYRTKLFFNHIIICVSLLLKLFIKISRNLEKKLIIEILSLIKKTFKGLTYQFKN